MSTEKDFWSRRRAGVSAEAEAEEKRLQAEVLAQEQAELAEKSDAEILQDLNLPDPDTLTTGDDFTVFMARAVPERIRRRALRTLWRSNPVLANVDSLVDYGEDFTDSATVVENLQTAYQIGKGMLEHVEEMARQAEQAEAPEDIAPPRARVDTEIDAPVPVLADAPTVPPPANTVPEETLEDDHAFIAAAPRRMRFQQEESAT